MEIIYHTRARARTLIWERIVRPSFRALLTRVSTEDLVVISTVTLIIRAPVRPRILAQTVSILFRAVPILVKTAVLV